MFLQLQSPRSCSLSCQIPGHKPGCREELVLCLLWIPGALGTPGLTTAELLGVGFVHSFQQNSWLVLESRVRLTEQQQTNPEEIKQRSCAFLASSPPFFCLFSQFSDVSGHWPAIHCSHLFILHPGSFSSFPFLYLAPFSPSVPDSASS